MTTLGWILIATGVLLVLGSLLAWGLCAAAALGDEIDRQRRRAEQHARNGVEILSYPEPEYRPVSRRHWRGL